MRSIRFLELDLYEEVEGLGQIWIREDMILYASRYGGLTEAVNVRLESRGALREAVVTRESWVRELGE